MRGGGLAGLVRVVSVDTERLTSEDAAKFAILIGDAGLLDHPETKEREEPAPDQFSYVITVEQAAETREVVFSEQPLPGSVKRLIAWIEGVEGHTESIQPPGR